MENYIWTRRGKSGAEPFWDEPEQNWLANNLRVAAALAEAGYDFRLVLGDGGHSPNHGGTLIPDALRWLWRPAARP